MSLKFKLIDEGFIYRLATFEKNIFLETEAKKIDINT